MAKALLDTNIIIMHLTSQLIIPFPRVGYAISTLTIFELLQLPGLSSPEEESLRAVISICSQLTVTVSIAERAAHLSRTRQRGAIDLLIAATALEHHLPLITKNTSDFRGLPGLKVQASFEG